MKKKLKITAIVMVAVFFKLLLVLSLLCLIMHWLFVGYTEHKVKTKYGDVFIVTQYNFDSECDVRNAEHNFNVSLLFYNSKKDFIPICDTDYFRCYNFKNMKEDIYIFGFKNGEDYFWIRNGEAGCGKKSLKNIRENFLSDKYSMEILLDNMDYYYHDEMLEIAEKLISGDYAGLEEYGLTEEMINDKESLDEKIKIMNDYLDSQSSNQ